MGDHTDNDIFNLFFMIFKKKFFLTVHALEDWPRRVDAPAICGNDPKVAMPQKQDLTDTRVVKCDFSRKTNTWHSQRHLLDVPVCTVKKQGNQNGVKSWQKRRGTGAV